MLICVVFVTLPYVVASGANIRLEEGLHLLPQRMQRLIHLAIAATGAVAFGVTAASIARRDAAQSAERHPDARHSLLGVLLGGLHWVCRHGGRVRAAALEGARRGARPTCTFADEAPPDDMGALEAALVAEADRGAEGRRDDISPARRLHGILPAGLARGARRDDPGGRLRPVERLPDRAHRPAHGLCARFLSRSSPCRCSSSSAT